MILAIDFHVYSSLNRVVFLIGPWLNQVISKRTTSQKVALRLFTQRWRITPPPPFEVNSNGSTPTPGRGLTALGLLMDFLQVHQNKYRILYIPEQKHLSITKANALRGRDKINN
jgi:hypothetical protein